jgi:DUF4097 and DUF4098 domain-containing protein YvlB
VNPLVAGGVALALAAVGSSALSLTQVLLRSERTTVIDLAGPVERLVVEVDSGDVRVVATDREDVSVERTETWSIERPSVREEVVDGVLRVRADCSAVLSWCDVAYVLQVPTGVTVLARTGSGALELQGTGDVRADTGSGEVQLSSVDGDADVRSGSGDVVLDAVRGDSVVARTGSGDVTVTRADVRRVSGRTGSGDVDLGMRTPPDEVQARTGSGDVEVELPFGDEAYAVSVNTGSGDSNVDVRDDPDSDRVVDLRTGSGDASVVYAGVR